MGIFNRKRAVAQTPKEPASTLGAGDVIPADNGLKRRLSAQGSAIAGRATEFYRQNPKLVGGVALIASALLLSRMRRPHP